MSLRARLLLIVALAALLPAGLVGWRFFQEREHEISEAKRTLSASALHIGDQLEAQVQGTAQLHFGLSRARDLDTIDRAACSEFLAAVLKERPQYTGLLTILPDGSLLCDSLRSGRTLDLRDRDYFKQALTQRGSVALQPVFGRLTGMAVLQIAYPVHDGAGPLKFVLLASLNLDRFTQDRRRELVTSNPQILLVDDKGTVLVWSGHGPSRQAAGTSIADSALFRLAKQTTGAAVAEIVGWPTCRCMCRPMPPSCTRC